MTVLNESIIPRLSIITINFNNAFGLKKTIESVINQTYTDYEYIIIDGKSIDISVEIINKYRDKIKYWISEPDSGIYNAQNKGIRKARGEYCLFLNSGDILVNKDVLFFTFKNNPQEDLIYGDGIFVNGESEKTFKYPCENDISFRFFINNSLCHPSIFFKRILFKKFGYYNENLTFASDWEFYLLAIFKYSISISKIDMPIAKFNLDGISSTSKNRKKMFYEREAILEKHFQYFLIDYKKLEILDKQFHVKIYRLLKKIFRFKKVKIFE